MSATFVPAPVLLAFIAPLNNLHYVTPRKEQEIKKGAKPSGKNVIFPPPSLIPFLALSADGADMTKSTSIKQSSGKEQIKIQR